MISITRHNTPPGALLLRQLESALWQKPDGLSDVLPTDASRRDLAAGDMIVRGDGVEPATWLVVSGIAGEVRTLADGRRQIVGLRLPGDLVMGEARECIQALTPVQIADARSIIHALSDASAVHQPLRRAWVAASRIEQARLRDHVVRLGRLTAFERLANLFSEIHDRLGRVGLASPTAFHLPLTQDAIGDLLGLSVVHVSRTVQSLRRAALADVRNGYVMVLDRPGLMEAGHYASRFASPAPLEWANARPSSAAGMPSAVGASDRAAAQAM